MTIYKDHWYDRVEQYATCTGTAGAYTLGAVMPGGFRRLQDVAADTNRIRYLARDPVSGAWEVGRGVFNAGAGTLVRSVLVSSSTGSFINWAGTETLEFKATAPSRFFEEAVLAEDVVGILPGRLSVSGSDPYGESTGTGTLSWVMVPGLGETGSFYNPTQSRWKRAPVGSVSITPTVAANSIYDAFVWYTYGNSGGWAGNLYLQSAWTNDTTRATALAEQDRVYAMSGNLERRYVGTVRTNASGQFQDSVDFRGVWNYYNQVPRTLFVTDTGVASYTYHTAAARQVRANSANKVSTVVGVSGRAYMELVARHLGIHSTGGNRETAIGAGGTATVVSKSNVTGGAVISECVATYYGSPAAGFMEWWWLEYGPGAATGTWYLGTGATFLGNSLGLYGYIMA